MRPEIEIGLTGTAHTADYNNITGVIRDVLAARLNEDYEVLNIKVYARIRKPGQTIEPDDELKYNMDEIELAVNSVLSSFMDSADAPVIKDQIMAALINVRGLDSFKTSA